MKFRHALIIFTCIAAALLLNACQVDTPSFEKIRDSKLFDRRIKETPRQKVLRECQQECDRFRVDCVHCHNTNKAEDIRAPDRLELNKVGERARIMRTSPSFGLNQNCATCHQSKFRLNRTAEKMFGPGGSKYTEAQKALKTGE